MASPNGESNSQLSASADAITADVSRAWETVDRLIASFFAGLPKFAIAAAVFAIFLAGAWLTQRVVLRLTRRHPSAHIGRVLARLSRWAVNLIGVMVSVAIVAPSVTPAKLLGALGVGSVAIGFAFKDVLQNFLAGILILLRQPFRVGDAVRYGDHEGVVEEIDTRLTIIKTYDGRQVLIPNGEIYTHPIVVVTAYQERRQQYDVGVSYDDDLGQACAVILSAMQASEGVLSAPSPDVLVNELGASSVNLRARWWAPTGDVLAVKSRVIRAIKEALDDAGIEMPYPTQVSLGPSPQRQASAQANGTANGKPNDTNDKRKAPVR